MTFIKHLLVTYLLVLSITIWAQEPLYDNSISLKLSSFYADFAKGDINNDGADDDFVFSFTNQQYLVVRTERPNVDPEGVFGARVFAPLIKLPVKNTSNSVNLSDIDGDSDLDVFYTMIGSPTNENVGMYLNNGSQGFSNNILPVSIQNPNNIIVGKFNNDEFADIVISNESRIKVLLGDENQLFGDQLEYESTLEGNLFQDLVLTDLDKDGQNEFLVNLSADGFLLVQINDNNFEVTRLKSSNRIIGLSMGDVDKDGNQDILSSEENDGYYTTIRFGDGDLSFSDSLVFELPDLPSGKDITVGDVEGDGDNDILLKTIETGQSFIIIENLGDRVLELKPIQGTNNSSSSEGVYLFDFGDRPADQPIVLNTFSSERLNRIFFSADYNTRSFSEAYFIPQPKGGEIIHLFPAQNPYLLGIDYSGSEMNLYSKLNSLEFTLDTTYATPIASNYIHVFDANNDGYDDLIVGNAGSQLYLNNQNGQLVPDTLFQDLGLQSFSYADFDSDNDIDLFLEGIILKNDGNGNYSQTQSLGVNFTSSAFTDVDNDGDLDLISTNQGNDKLIIYSNNGSGSFTSTQELNFRLFNIEILDFNDDNFTDLIGFGSFQDSIYMFTNNNGVLNKSHSRFMGNLDSRSALIADFDDDSNDELAMAQFQEIKIFNITAEELVPYDSFENNTVYSTLISLDINEDNRTDIVGISTNSDILVLTDQVKVKFEPLLLIKTYDGFQANVSSNTIPPNVPYAVTYDGNDDAPTNSGTYAVSFFSTDENFEGQLDTTLVIEKVDLTISVNDTTLIYGKGLPDFSFKFSGFVSGEDEFVLDQPVEISTDLSETPDVGTYTIEISNLTDNNYEIETANGVFTVSKSNLTVAPDDQSIRANENLPELTYSLQGLQYEDSKESIDVPPSIFVDIENTATPGTYAINASGAEDLNYTFSYDTAVLLIEEPLSISSQTEIVIGPNPAENEIIVSKKSGLKSYGIVSLNGKNLKNGSLTNSNRIDITHLPSGTYIIKLVGQNKIYNFKFIKSE